MTSDPTISVLMPVYNAEAFVSSAIDSILAQTFSDFEFVIVEEPSEDRTSNIIASYDDDRIVRVMNDERRGLVTSLNRGLKHCRGTFIARMDADDISRADRLETQARFLREHPEVGIVGSNHTHIDPERNEMGTTCRPVSDLAIRWRSLFATPFTHPTVMLRRQILETNDLKYDDEYLAVEDYELWTRLLQHTNGRNIPQPLLKYRVSYQEKQSVKNREQKWRNHTDISTRTLNERFPDHEFSVTDVEHLLRLLFPNELTKGSITRNTFESYFDLLKWFVEKHEDNGDESEVKTRAGIDMIRAFLATASVKQLPILCRYLLFHPRFALDGPGYVLRCSRKPLRMFAELTGRNTGGI